MLNTDTRELLKNLLSINNSMIIAPTMTGCDEFKNILFKAELHKIDSGLQEFGIFDATVFLQAMELLEEPVISFDDATNKITAKDENTSIEYIASDISSLDYVQVPEENIDTTVAAASVTEFAFDTDTLGKIKKAKAVFKNFDTLFVQNDGTVITLSIGNQNTFSKNNNSWTLNIEPTLNNGSEFNLALPLDSIMKLPLMGYSAQVKYNEKRDTHRVVVQNELLAFVLSLKK